MKRVAVIYDVLGWCWYYQACDLLRYAPDDLLVTAHDPTHSDCVLQHQLDQYAAALQFAWPEAPTAWPVRTVSVLAHHGCQYEVPAADGPWPALAATTARRNRTEWQKRIDLLAGWICVNRPLYHWARQHTERAVYLPAGVDADYFTPVPRTRSGPLRVGLCAQRPDAGRVNTKGYPWVVAPLEERLRSEADRVQLVVNGRTSRNALPRPQLREWYRGLDCLLVTSISEGTPVPALEAMACGVPVIGTPVGDLPELIDGSNGYLVGGYRDAVTARQTVEQLADVLLSSDRQQLQGWGAEARHTVSQQRHWRTLAPRWLNYVTYGDPDHEQEPSTAPG